ncbi:MULTISPECIES: hypothetical protein [Pseudoalteromonas]|uniref:hypothetical protein n=1 Tax=Pseudoalteromonas TaxID=53246 RepID=UPI00029AC18D|nr:MULTISPECIES: hypothetical protein [Pseudoalteromonas]MBR8845482.1 hypothetical protein [Pseudoalteromonas sp. JC3]NSY34943.1 hypothetical protein [Pseudoalteromonas sp. JC28]UDM60178.1 hypothetical protein KIJ96_09910 [Pseudoalteromonas piscicida]WJE08691.1 hypothetical protein QSH61_17835 [Pseudoalteromonas sp. JC3]
MSAKKGVILLAIGATIFFSTALAHLSCIYFGPQCYSSQMAPPEIIESAMKGTLLAPIGTTLVSAIFMVLGLYALSGAGLLRKLPLSRFCIYLIAFVCIIRGVLPIQLYFRYPDKTSNIVLSIGITWLLVGLLCFFGYRTVNKQTVGHFDKNKEEAR